VVTTATVGPDEGSITGARSRVRWRPASRAGGSWPRGATDAVRRGLVSAAILWELLWFGSQSFLWPTEQSTPLASLSIVLVLVSVLVLLGSHLVGSGRLVPRASLLNVVVLVLATVAVGVSQFSLTTPRGQKFPIPTNRWKTLGVLFRLGPLHPSLKIQNRPKYTIRPCGRNLHRRGCRFHQNGSLEPIS